MKYNVEVAETLSRIITLEAPTAELACEKVQDEYNNENIVLDSNDKMGDTDFIVMRDEVPDDFPVDYIVK